jgi:hypothetical protein
MLQKIGWYGVFTVQCALCAEEETGLLKIAFVPDGCFSRPVTLFYQLPMKNFSCCRYVRKASIFLF